MQNKSFVILSQLLATLQIEAPPSNTIKIEGADPVLPSPFLIGEAGASAMAGVGYLASKLWTLKTGEQQTIALSIRDAAMAQRSHQYIKCLDGENQDLWDPLSGFYQTKDGRWIQYHCNFTHHKEGILKILNCSEAKDAVIAATKTFNGIELEAKLQDSGLCAALVRSCDEWHAHSQYHALQGLPPIEIIKLGESNAKPLPDGPRPLSHLQILDLTRIIAGPVCTRTLAEHGAIVTLITSPHLPNILPLVMDTGHGKRSIYLDLNQEEDHKKLESMIAISDIFCQSYRPGSLNARGLSPQNLSKLNPHLIYVTIDAYSHQGPWSSYRGFDSLVQSVTGMAWEQGNHSYPQHLPAQTLDYITGYFGAIGAMEALRRRALYGGSYLVRVSLAKTAKWFMDLGRCENYQHCTIPNATQIQDLLTQTQTAFGVLEHMIPILKMSHTSPYYSSPPVPLGSSPDSSTH